MTTVTNAPGPLVTRAQQRLLVAMREVCSSPAGTLGFVAMTEQITPDIEQASPIAGRLLKALTQLAYAIDSEQGRRDG